MKLATLMRAMVMVVAGLDARSALAAEDALTSAKLAADLGDVAQAERLLVSVADDAAATGARRGEAWTRLGAIRRERGDAAGANAAFRSALAQGGADTGVLALLARTLEGVSPDEAVVLAAVGRAALVEEGGRLRLDLGTQPGDCASDSALPVTLSMQDGDLADAAWLIAQAGGIPIVAPRCLSSPTRKVSLDLRAVPAGQALDSLVRLQGLRCARQGRLLLIGCAEAPPLEASTCTVTVTEPISIDVRFADVADMLRLFGEVLGTPIHAQPCAVRGAISLRLSDISAGDLLCAVARTNGWTIERRQDGIHVGCANEEAEGSAPALSKEWRLQDVLASLAQDADRDIFVGRNVSGTAVMPSSGEPGANLSALIAGSDLRAVDVAGISLLVPAADAEAASQPSGVPTDFPAASLAGPNQTGGAWEVAGLIAKASGRLVVPGCRAVGVWARGVTRDVSAAAYLDAWCRASGLKLRASGPVLFAWEPPCEGPKGDVVRASARDGRIELEVKDILAPHVVAMLNLLTDSQLRLDVALRERVVSLSGTWSAPEGAARALAAHLGTEATWSEPHHAWLIGPPTAPLLGDGFRRYAVKAEAMPLGAWLELVRPLVGRTITVAQGVDLSRGVPLNDFHDATSGDGLVFELEYRLPYRVKWSDDGITIGP